MTTTITKRADELKPGDVISRFDRPTSVVIQGAAPVHVGEVKFLAYDIGAREIITVEVGCSADYAVEAPTLTPAQQHAEELLRFVRKIAASDYAQADEEASEVLAKIDPPQPPTLEEVIKALDSIEPDYMPASAKQVLERYRRAKIIQ